MSNINEFIPLYFNCRFYCKYPSGETILGVIENYCKWGFLHGECRVKFPASNYTFKYCEIDLTTPGIIFKLILTDPSELDDIQKKEYNCLTKKIKLGHEDTFTRVDTPDSIRWMLKNHVDAFDLISKGFAINKTQLANF